MMLTRLCKRFLASDRLAFIASFSAAITISSINLMLDSDLAHAVLYITLLFMSAHIFSIRIVLVVALFCYVLITGGFIVEYFYEATGSIAGYVRCVVSLITITLLTLRSKWSTDELRRNQAFLTSAQRLSRTGSIGWRFDNGQCKEIRWSDEAFRIYGYPQDIEPSWALMTARLHPDDRSMADDLFVRLAAGELDIDMEQRLIMPDASLRYVHMVINAIDPDSNAHSREYVAALMDITSERKAEQALFDSQAQLAHVTRMTSLGELAASIAHEVNQPLAAIVSSGESCLRWMDREKPDLLEAKLSVQRIIQSSQRANEVITCIRALSKKCVPQRQEHVFDSIVTDALVLIQQEMSHKHIKQHLSLGTGNARINGDRVQLQQVIINLVMNACQAMGTLCEGKRSLDISTWVERNEVLIKVEDSGKGIEEGQLPSLFNPFYTTKAEGLGMGLSICRSIIEFHEGRIWATSIKGQGAAFMFALPLLKHQAEVKTRSDRLNPVQPLPNLSFG
ncbi:sensor histidine kinase [Pseudomonas sp. PDM04]|uniref:sensor histidine kinase n=1 Tax=Pseudomonas sp. PDM04 TaxID=2769296 RepID=UPI001782163C|nr:ATP-binding protein [Pseudomonas sp. PDM04]MBD9439680.1 PAS domain-containing protein [Pseudomonas sp. PDM04]